MSFIIDAHCHIYPEKIAQKAVNAVGEFYNLKMRHKGTAQDLIDTGAKCLVKHFVICSVATRPEQVDSINLFLNGIVKTFPKNFSALATLHPDMKLNDIEKTINFALENNFKGFKLHPDFQKFDIDSLNTQRMYERLSGVLPVLFHTGDERYNFSQPKKLAEMLKKFKNLKAVAAHFGGYSRWQELDCYLGLDNIYFDTSSSLFKLPTNSALEIIDKFGIDRFMFGTDYPMWNQESELKRIYSLNLSQLDNLKILGKNAQKIYNIKI